MRISRKNLTLVAAGITLSLGGIVALSAAWLLKTQRGRDFIGRQLESLVRSNLHGGRVYFGHLGGSLLGSPSIDSLEIRDADDSVLVATGVVRVEFDLIDLWDGRVALQNLLLQHPFVHLRHDATGAWNYQKLFASTSTGPSFRAPGCILAISSCSIRSRSTADCFSGRIRGRRIHRCTAWRATHQLVTPSRAPTST